MLQHVSGTQSGDAHSMAVLPPVSEDREDLSENHVLWTMAAEISEPRGNRSGTEMEGHRVEHYAKKCEGGLALWRHILKGRVLRCYGEGAMSMPVHHPNRPKSGG